MNKLCVDRVLMGFRGMNVSPFELVVRIATDDPEAIGLVIADIGPAGDPESEAYAALFAAAPDLLRLLTSPCSKSQPDFATDLEFVAVLLSNHGYDAIAADLLVRREAIRRAVARAKGSDQ